MRPSNMLRLYRARLRARLGPELFAVLGIAVGVALLFASQVASTSLNGSIRQMTSGIVGSMRLQLAARAPEGFDEGLLARAQRLPGVAAAVPLLEERVEVVGPGGERTVELLGVDPHLAGLGGPLVRRLGYAQLSTLKALALSASIASAIHVSALRPVRLRTGAGAVGALVGTTLNGEDVGPLASSPVALGPLAYVQQLTGMQGRLTHIFVSPRPGREAQAAAGLRALAGGALNVRPADFEATLFAQAAGPTNKSTDLFSAISALVGFIFAFNAMLLTVPERRHLVEDLRLDGYTAAMIARVLLLDALVLGALGSLVGLALGELLSRELFNANPGYLSLGFPVGSLRIVSWQNVALAVGGGLAAACVGVLAPLRREILAPMPRAFAAPRHLRWMRVGEVALGAACLAATTLVLAFAPQQAIAGTVSLIAALLLLLPAVLAGVVALVDRARRSLPGVSPFLAVIELRSRANRSRALAVGATGAIAVFGSVAIQGAHGNLQQGLDGLVHELNAPADVWVLPPGGQNLLATTPFRPLSSARLRHLPDAQDVQTLHAGLLDFQVRRVWVLAPPAQALPIPPGQLVEGSLARAGALLREGGWAAVSQALADEHHLRIGASFTLPAPRPVRLRVAALITNLGWPPGAVILAPADYERGWTSAMPSAYYVHLRPGVPVQDARTSIQAALGGASGLTAESSHARELRQRASSRQGLTRLTQISWLVLIAAVLAMGAAMGSMVWQRRRQLAELKVEGFGEGELWRGLLLESALLLGTGCSLGAAFGIYGQVLLSHALASVTGFPVIFSVNGASALTSFALVTVIAVLIVAVPGHVAARVRPAVGLQE